MRAILEDGYDAEDAASLVEACKSGVLLCRMINRICELCDPPQPPPVKKINESKLAFKVPRSHHIGLYHVKGIAGDGKPDELHLRREVTRCSSRETTSNFSPGTRSWRGLLVGCLL